MMPCQNVVKLGSLHFNGCLFSDFSDYNRSALATILCIHRIILRTKTELKVSYES